jgi:hypothetical protein
MNRQVVLSVARWGHRQRDIEIRKLRKVGHGAIRQNSSELAKCSSGMGKGNIQPAQHRYLWGGLAAGGP